MDKHKIAAKIRALRAKTVENGCTEQEAAQAAAMVAKMLEKYNLSIDECDLRENEFARSDTVVDDPVGERLWKIGDGISYMMDVRYWTSRPGEVPSVTFFGFAHEVEIATYLLEICRAAMTYESQRCEAQNRLLRASVQRRHMTAFLDGMSDRLRERLRDLKPKTTPGKGLIVLRNDLIDAEMAKEGINLNERAARGSRDFEPEYQQGVAAADGVALNQGVRGPSSDALRIGGR